MQIDMDGVKIGGNIYFPRMNDDPTEENYLYDVTLVNDDKVVLSFEGRSLHKLNDEEIRLLESTVENYFKNQIGIDSVVNKEISTIKEITSNRNSCDTYLTYYKSIRRELESLIEKQYRGTLIVYVCKVCEKESRSSNHAKEHAEIHMEGLKFTCQLCGKDFKTSNALRCHKKVHKSSIDCNIKSQNKI